jgi:hypothetical protein
MSDVDDRQWLLAALQEQLQSDWKEFRDLYHNSKGAQYERTLANLFEQYFGGVYDVRTRAAVIDPDGDCFDAFDFRSGSEELDIVASFQQSKPRVVFETGDESNPLPWVPYEGVAFVCEVKSRLDKAALDSDLFKLGKLTRLDETIADRFGPKIGGKFTVDDPLKLLVYDKASIDDEVLNTTLEEASDDWHMLLIAENDTLLMNTTLPVSNQVVPSASEFGPEPLGELPEFALEFIESETGYDTDPEIVSLDRGLLWFVAALSISIPDPLSVSTTDSILSLFRGTRTASGARTSVESHRPDD